jgi:hypothetical protein
MAHFRIGSLPITENPTVQFTGAATLVALVCTNMTVLK